MTDNTIDTAMAKRLVEAAAILGAAVIGRPGGWSVMLKLGSVERPLGTQRTDKPRLWRSLDRCIDYLKNELGIARVDLLDATNFDPVAVGDTRRVATSERMRRTHEAAIHDKWFRAQVGLALAEADDRGAEWVTDEDAKASWLKKRVELVKRTKGPVA